MIDYIAGEIAELTPTTCVVDCHGVGYEANITLIDHAALSGAKHTKLFVHESIREDAHVLFGFLSREGRALFRLLIGVSGVGPGTARLIMSSMPVEQLETAIASGEDKVLKAVKGIGGKTAQRIIVDLKDKINVSEISFNPNTPTNQEAQADALQALVMLGFTPLQSRKALKSIYSSDPNCSTEEAIKLALKMM